MNKKTWLLIAIVYAIWICLFPVVVFGEASTYSVLSGCNEIYTNNNTNRTFKINTNSNVRAVWVIQNGTLDNLPANTWSYIMLVSESPFKYSSPSYSNNACSSTMHDASTHIFNNTTYYIYVDNRSNVNITNYTSLGIPVIVDSELSNRNYENKGIYYTFGEGAVGPVEPITWGLLRDTTYTTRIAGSGQAAKQNIDVLTWEKSIDTNGNDISECEVEIQAVYGKFTGNTINDLWETDVQDLAISGSVSLATVSASSGMYSVSWQKVIDDLNRFDFDSLFAHEVNEQIEKNGWYYQIRLLGSDGYIGSWQTLYTPLSMGGKASETIITQNSFDMSVYQVYQDLSTINNNTSITITYIDTDYTINNPNDGTEPEGGTNLWDVLKELISGIFQILAKLGDLVGNLIDGLMGIFQNLFTPTEVDQQINNNINVEVNTYLEESQPGLNQIHNNIDTWKLQLEDIASNYANGGDCIITWEDVTIDLSAFNAGTVTFIPGGTYDLKTAFISLLTAFGVSYSTYEMIVSAIIYISLIVLISHKVKGFLKT